MAPRWSEDDVIRLTGAERRGGSARQSFEGVSTDTRSLAAGALFVALVGERLDAHDFLGDAVKAGAAGVLLEKGRAFGALPSGIGVYEVPSTLRALGELGAAHRGTFKGPLGAVGGSNGKTTTKEMVGAILEARGPALKTEGNYNNEIGVPLTLLRLEPSRHVAAVVELGMNHPGEVTRLTRMAEPDAGLLTVVQPEHLEGLGSLEGVAQAEGELFRALKPSAVAVVNLDDPLIVAQANASGRKQLTFGRATGAQVRLGQVSMLGREGLEMDVSYAGATHRVRLGFLGEHNALNATGAFALGIALGYSASECVKGLEQAKPYARRLNVLDGAGGITIIDDCYNANPASMLAALDTLKSLSTGEKGRGIAVLGDMLELGSDELEEHAKLGAQVRGRAQIAAFFGPRSEQAFDAAQRLPAAHFTEVEPLLAWLRPQLKEGDVVLVKASRGMRLERVVEALASKAND